MLRVCLLVVLFSSCVAGKKVNLPERKWTLSGTEFFSRAAAMGWKARDSFAVKEILSGNVPGFFGEFVPVDLFVLDSNTGKNISATIFVSKDYLSVGTNDDWARIPLTPMAVKIIADSIGCFLPTRKLVDEIYKSAKVKLAPMPMYAYRDSTVTMFHHHLIIEGQRKGRSGLIAGIKKDVVMTSGSTMGKRADRVAIYGWHKLDGKAIQPLYLGHINWYVDYSHGIRLIWRKMKVEGKWMDYEEVMRDPVLVRLICDEPVCDFN